MNKDVTRQLINIVAFVATVIVNGLATGLPLNGQDTGAISDSFDVYFVPAGYVFSIWGLIYLLLLGFVIYQALPAQRENPALRKIGYLFVWSSVANSVWLFFWHYLLFPLSLVVMLLLLASLIAIYQALETQTKPVSMREKWLVHMPFRVYWGWITVATIANVTNTLDSVGFTGGPLSPEAWMIIILGAVLVIAGLMARNRNDTAYLLVLVWALVGITVKQAGVAVVVNATWVTAILVGLMAVWTIVRGRIPSGKTAPA